MHKANIQHSRQKTQGKSLHSVKHTNISKNAILRELDVCAKEYLDTSSQLYAASQVFAQKHQGMLDIMKKFKVEVLDEPN